METVTGGSLNPDPMPETTAAGLRIWIVRYRFGQDDELLTREQGQEHQRRIQAICNTVTGDPKKARALYQDNGRSVVVWIDRQEDHALIEKLRKWLWHKGVFVSEVFYSYEVAMA